MAMTMPPTQMDHFALQGGLNLVTPPMAIDPGMCRDAQNYEIGIDGGYRRIDGYCRTDGRVSPADATYHVLPCTFTGSVAVGNTITGATSGATGVVIAVEAAAIVFTKKTGVFAAEVIRVSGAPVATSTATSNQGGASSAQLHWQYLSLAANVYRADISAVPGQGSIRGVVLFAGVLYAFRDKAGGATAGMYKATASGWTLVTTPTLQPGGRYDFAEYNFGSGRKLYGCSGVDKAFQFDGTTFTQIATGMATDTPSSIAAHQNHLFLAFGNSLQHSGIGDPLSWTPISGAAELNFGETITNLKPQPGDDSGAAIAVYTRNGTHILYGTSSANWKRVTFDPNAGALPYTAQHMGQTFVLDDRGVATIQTTQNYGNFAAASLSALVRPYIAENKGLAIASGVSRDKNQYRIFFSNGRALYYTLGKGFMPMVFAHNIVCFWSGEDSNGDEAMYAGDDQGYVYQFDKGTSFDGQSIDAFMVLVFNHIKSPRVVKRYRKAMLEVEGDGYAEFWMSADLGYSSPEYGAIQLSHLIAQLAAARWDYGTWDSGVWDGRILAPVEYELTGSAENISLHIAQSSTWQASLTFFGVTTSYTTRRLLR